MISHHILPLVLTLTLLVPTAFANKKDAEAAALIEHAKQLSDIRAEGTPAFRLRLSFKTIKQDGSAIEGAYTEVWVSKTRWHKATVLGDFRRTQVAAQRDTPQPTGDRTHHQDLVAGYDLAGTHPHVQRHRHPTGRFRA